MNNSRLIKTVVTRMTSGKKKRGRPRTKWMSKSKYGVMGVSLTVFIGPKFTLMSLWHQWVLSHEDLNKYSMVLGANVVLCMTVSDFFLGGGGIFFFAP